jgi:hypothetical protein
VVCRTAHEHGFTSLPTARAIPVDRVTAALG